MINSISTFLEITGLLLAIIDHRGWTPAIERAVDGTRRQLGTQLGRMGLYTMIKLVFGTVIPTKDPPSKVSWIAAFIGTLFSPLYVVLAFLIVLAPVSVLDLLGIIGLAPFDMFSLVISYAGLAAVHILGYIDVFPTNFTNNLLGPAIFLAIIVLLGYFILVLSIMILLLVLNIVHKCLILLDKPKAGTVVTVGLLMAVLGVCLDYFEPMLAERGEQVCS